MELFLILERLLQVSIKVVDVSYAISSLRLLLSAPRVFAGLQALLVILQSSFDVAFLLLLVCQLGINVHEFRGNVLDDPLLLLRLASVPLYDVQSSFIEVHSRHDVSFYLHALPE